MLVCGDVGFGDALGLVLVAAAGFFMNLAPPFPIPPIESVASLFSGVRERDLGFVAAKQKF